MSIFDPQSFLDSTTTEASKKRPPLPAGEVLVGIIGELKPPRVVQGKKDTTQTYYFLDIPIEFDLTSRPDLAKLVGLTKVTIQDQISLQLTDDGKLDMSPGKNSRLGRYREALGLNEDGTPFSMRQLVGRQVRAKIKHDPYEGEVYDKIDSVAKV